MGDHIEIKRVAMLNGKEVVIDLHNTNTGDYWKLICPLSEVLHKIGKAIDEYSSQETIQGVSNANSKTD